MTDVRPGAPAPLAGRAADNVAGVALAAVLATVAWLLARAWSGIQSSAPDAVVLALLLGIAVRSLLPLPAATTPGLSFSGRQVLEAAIVLLGVSTDLRDIIRGGPGLAASVVFVTILALGAGVAIARLTGLTRTHALLVASGNAICGNSAIAAVSTVVRAPPEETASAIAWTALLSIGVVLLLPAVGALADLRDTQYGVLAGLSVYSVPQVLAAAYPVSARASEIATLVKLIRVLVLVPWLLFLAQHEHRRGTGVGRQLSAAVLPPYLLAYLAFAALRTSGNIPAEFARTAQLTSHAFTVVAMAALGLGVDVRSLRHLGGRATVATVLSLVVLLVMALGVARFVAP